MRSLVAIFLIASQLFVGAKAFAADEVIHLLGINAEDNAGKTSIYFQFSKPVSAANMEVRFLRRTIEWDLKNIQLKKDKIFKSVGYSQVSNVYVSQADATTTRIRVNMDNGATASDFHDRLSFVKEGSSLILTMDSAVALSSNAIKEMSRVYTVAKNNEAKMVDHLAASSTLTVNSTPAVAANSEAVEPLPVENTEAVAAVTSLENKSESEIPLNAKSAVDSSSSTPSATRMAIGLVAVLLLGASVFLVGKKINAKRLSAPFSHDSIKVISQKYLGPKRNLTLVRVAGEYMLLGVTDANISLIKTLSIVEDEIPELSPGDFSSAIKNLTQSSKPEVRLTARASADDMVDEIEDSFSVSSLNDVKTIMRKRKYIDEADV